VIVIAATRRGSVVGAHTFARRLLRFVHRPRFLVGIAVGLFFVASAGRDGALWFPARLLALRAFERLGLFSYSIYLLHVPFVYTLYELIVMHRITGVAANLLYVALIPAVLVVSYGWYRVLERPFMSSRLRAAVQSVPDAFPATLFAMPEPSRTA